MKKGLLKFGILSTTALLLLWLLVSCDNESDKIADGKASIQFKLTDAPAWEYDEVNIDIQGLRVGVADDDEVDDVEWIDLNVTHPGIYNLLDYRNGKTVLLAGGDIPAGKISQFRLILGDDSYVVVDGVEYPLDTPSAQSSGLKFNLHETLLEGLAYSFVIDFDASRSIVRRGNGTYGLKPVIRTYADAFGGTIKGVALPARTDTVGVAYVQLINGEDTLISIPEDNGAFLFPGLEPLLWDLTVVADTNTTFSDKVVNDILVKVGEVVDLGVIDLEE